MLLLLTDKSIAHNPNRVRAISNNQRLLMVQQHREMFKNSKIMDVILKLH